MSVCSDKYLINVAGDKPFGPACTGNRRPEGNTVVIRKEEASI
jgi:hypothetical protein